MTKGVVDRVVDTTSKYGSVLLETGGFLMAGVGTDAVSSVALAGESGIVRNDDRFQISARALDQLFSYADTNKLWLPIQFHSHQYEAGMSRTDALHGLRVEGFVSAILPKFANPPADPDEWTWWQFTSGSWQTCSSVVMVPGSVGRVVLFDEDGVHER